MSEHPTRPGRAALAAAALAVTGLVALSFALVVRDGPGGAPRSAAAPAAGPATAPVPTIGTSVSTRRSARAGVDAAREPAAGNECQDGGASTTVDVGNAKQLQRALDKAAKASASAWPTASTRASSPCAARARPASGSRCAGRAGRCCGATP